MNKKPFELPKDFLEKWIKALRSGDYKQGIRSLITYYEKTDGTVVTGYCCLGVACSIIGIEDSKLIGNSYPNRIKNIEHTELPLLLVNKYKPYNYNTSLVGILASLNDGLDVNLRHNIENQYETINFGDNISMTKRYSFEEIADFLEENVKSI